MSSFGNVLAGLGALGRGYSQGLDMYEDRKVKERKRQEAEQRKALGDEFLNTFYTQEPVQTGTPMQSGLDNMPATKGAGGSTMLDLPQIGNGDGSRQPARPTSGNAPPANGLTNRQQQGGWRVRDDLSVEDLSKKYMDFQMRAAMVPGASEQYQPLFNAMKNYGVSRYMEDFDGDITTVEGASKFFQHQGKAMAMFGDAMDPSKVVTMARALQADRRDQARLGLEQQRFGLTERKTEQDMELAANRDTRAQNVDDRAAAKESRDQETFDLERATKESEAIAGQIESLTQRLAMGDAGGAQKVLSALYPQATLGETKTETLTVGGQSMPVIKFQITDPEGNSTWLDTGELNRRIGQIKGWQEAPSKDKSKPNVRDVLLNQDPNDPGSMFLDDRKIPAMLVEDPNSPTGYRYQPIPVGEAGAGQGASANSLTEPASEKAEDGSADKNNTWWKTAADLATTSAFGHAGNVIEAARSLFSDGEPASPGQGPENGLTAPSVTQPTEATQPGKQKPVEVPQLEEGAQFADPSRGIVVIQNGKETVAWPNGERRRGPDGKIYVLKNGKPVPEEG